MSTDLRHFDEVFLGPKQYFVSSDVGQGQQQYYAFLDVPAGGDDRYAKCEEWANYREMLLDRFQSWCPAVLERLECTKPEDVERRDVYDVLPNPWWGLTLAHVAVIHHPRRDMPDPPRPSGLKGSPDILHPHYILHPHSLNLRGERGPASNRV